MNKIADMAQTVALTPCMALTHGSGRSQHAVIEFNYYEQDDKSSGSWKVNPYINKVFLLNG